MKITILTYGSRGDVQPYLALAVGLKNAGHNVCLAAPARFADFVAQFGIDFTALAGDPHELSKRINDVGHVPLRMVKSMRDYIFAIAPQVVQKAFAACEHADLIVHSFLFTTGAHSFARARNIPDVSVQIFPMFAPTRVFPNVALPNVPSGWMSYFTHWMATQIFWYGGNSGYGKLRRSAPNANFPSRLYFPFDKTPNPLRTPLLFIYSPVVLPKPEDWTAPHIHVTGYCFLPLDKDYEPPKALTDFLSAGEPPVCVSFGSMVNRDAARIHQIVCAALKQTGKRGIILAGWGQKNKEFNNQELLYLDEAPHEFLFPKCQAVIHHGGAGTTAAALRAGVPNIVIPHTADQPFWGKRVAAIGAGPEPIPVTKLTLSCMVAALIRADGPDIRERSQAAGRLIQAENGIKETIRIIETIL